MPDRRATAPRPPALAALLALACLCPAARAETSPWYVGVAQALIYDSNLYRVDDATALGSFSRSDRVSSTSLVAGLDQSIGRQRLYGNTRIGVNRYQNNDYLNDNSYDLTAGLEWSSVERLSGSLGLAASRNQRSFNVDSGPNAVQTRKNIESVAQVDATVRAGVVTRLTMEASLGYRRVGYSAPEFESSRYRQSRGALGARYQPGVATFGAALSLADSRYELSPEQAASGQAAEQVRRSSLDLTLNWPASGASNVYARLSPTRVAYDQFVQRDFSGVTGALKWNWTPTGKLKVESRVVHDIGQDSSFETFGGPLVVGTSNTGRTTTEARIALGYEPTAKISLNATWGAVHRSLLRTANVPGLSVEPASGSDDTRTLSVGARWTPWRGVQAGCDLARDERGARGGLTLAYDSNRVSCSGQFLLQ